MTSSFDTQECPECGKQLAYRVEWDDYHCVCGKKWYMKSDGKLGNIEPLYKRTLNDRTYYL